MPHGDLSDVCAWVLFGSGLQQILSPGLHLADVPFLDSLITPPALPIALGSNLEGLLKMYGMLLLVLWSMLFSVRWNPINGILPGLMLIGSGALVAHTTLNRFDAGKVVPRPFYVHAVIMVVAGLHLIFNPNPALPKAKNT
jgi:hypothetical protein